MKVQDLKATNHKPNGKPGLLTGAKVSVKAEDRDVAIFRAKRLGIEAR